MGLFPPRRPLILGFLLDFSASSAGPVGPSHVQQGGMGLDLNRYEFPTSRPSVSSTTEVPRSGLLTTLTLPSDRDSGSSTAASTEQNNRCT
jgi:hypothetical protein